MNVLLETRGASKAFAGVPILEDVDFSISEREIVAIVGYSGSGKTTFLSLLAGLIFPDSGEVRMRGTAVTGPGLDRGVVFQSYSLLPWLTVEGNVSLAVERVFGEEPRAERERRTTALLVTVGLEAARHKRPAELSGGMRQRVAVARALATEPDVLLMDEPFGALDALTRASLQDEIANLAREKAIVLVTNDVDEALLLADRVVPLGHGPAARLGPAVVVPGARPRDRRAVKHDPAFVEARRTLVAFLLASGRKERVA